MSATYSINTIGFSYCILLYVLLVNKFHLEFHKSLNLQVFVFLSAEYETPKNVLNQVY